MLKKISFVKIGLSLLSLLHLSLPIFATETSNVVSQSLNQTFIQSFIKHYEFNPEGRYTHEYHPFLLEKTAASFDGLEQRLQLEGLALAGRMVIFGYEENAVPCYYTNFRKPKINDEAILKNNRGWSLKLHNRFGIITGFLFKDFNELCAQKVGLPEPVFEHINPQSILVFDDRASIFQEHAFGQVFDLMCQARSVVSRLYEKQDIKGLLECIVTFWQLLYSNEFKIGNKQVAGTQDILFSIEYLKHLLRSPLPFIKFFTGPDITYPIEISCKQEKGATLNAQAFVKSVVKKLQPIDDASTVYVFCSFVDGVGKSTMLGNIKNWMKHGDAYEDFEHVDNTSSQLFEVFEFKEKVYIADLPAQISHYSYKPDGVVFVDARTELSEQQVRNVASFAQKHSRELVDAYRDALAKAQKTIQQKGYFAPEFNDVNNIPLWFLKNILLLGKEEDNRWIPFVRDHEPYLFHIDQPWELRVVRSLNEVKSEGLKNIAAEQMFFSAGIRFPLVYEDFLSELAKVLKAKNVEKVVFVDFLSMYPRSSRENIRINYLQQQMALLNKKFEVKHSLYRDFVSGGELLHCLLKRSLRSRLADAVELEIFVRLVLFNLIHDAHYAEKLKGIPLPDLTRLLEERISELSAEDRSLARLLVSKKFCAETAVLEQTYGLSKSFVNIQQFMVSAVLEYSRLIQGFLSENLVHDKLNYLWEPCGELILDERAGHIEPGALHDVVLKTQSGRSVRALYALSPDCKDEVTLTPALRLMRANWYLALCNLLYAQKIGHEHYFIERDQFWVPPLWIKRGPRDLVLLVQPICFEVWDKEKKVPPGVRNVFFHFNVEPMHDEYGLFDEKPYLLDWDVKATQRGIYAFDNDSEKAKKGSYTASVLSLWVHRYQLERGALVMPTSLLHERLIESVFWKYELNLLMSSALRNGEFKQRGAGILGGQRMIYSVGKQQQSAAKMFIRLLATLEMVIKDPDADVVVRYGNRDDFKAALMLFEKVTLPRYFGMFFPQGLFKNYDAVEPYPSWLFWDSIEA